MLKTLRIKANEQEETYNPVLKKDTMNKNI